MLDREDKIADTNILYATKIPYKDTTAIDYKFTSHSSPIKNQYT